MKNIGIKLFIFTFATILSFFDLAARNDYDKGKNKVSNNLTPAAGCASAVAVTSIELNNVRARLEGTGGSMWRDRSNNIASYNVPKTNSEDEDELNAIFAGALWMGGTDVNGQLKIAAVTFRNGNDFWPGPLNTTTADVDPETCSRFDQFFQISRIEVEEFVEWNQLDVADRDPNYSVPESILNWPGNGDPTLGQAPILAPFFDVDGDGFYDPSVGDYPKYDIDNSIDCRTQRDPRLFGDQTIWWVFNDKGNPHTESLGASIGMEIRAQAFAFATSDEVNSMTFYNYELINRSTFTLTNTYFGQWVDADLGNSEDDYVGCDAGRGLGYCYNGDENDEDNGNANGYGQTPPAIGIDFFEGPFADSDYWTEDGGITTDITLALQDSNGLPIGVDNPLTQDVDSALALNGVPYSGLGIGYSDGIANNERYGMRKFIYYNRSALTDVPGDGDPTTALQFYNYLQGIWRNGSTMTWGGNGNPATTNGTVFADLLFPADSDPLFWSTQGVVTTPENWSEFNAGDGGTANTPSDRRFLESAGPFTLEPGAVNDLTVGVVYARATSGDNLESIKNLQTADDKAQALFDNCFQITEGPDAPSLTIQEMDQELILYLSNPETSNNFNESYRLADNFIVIPDTLDGVALTEEEKQELKVYEFQGYQIYQVKNGLVSVEELEDNTLAVLVAQVDIKDGVTRLINHDLDVDLGATVPTEKVDGEDNGIKHSFRITEDEFATGSFDTRLVNHKTYHFIAIAYGYNQFKEFDPLDPLSLDGQQTPYLASRKASNGGGISSVSAIPHNPTPENGGTAVLAEYGDMPQITRLDGRGNGGNNLDLTEESIDAILANGSEDVITYNAGRGPINVQVVDPLSVKAGAYQIKFFDTTTVGNLADASWALYLPDGDSIFSDQSIALENEQILLDQGISVSIFQVSNPGEEKELGSGVLNSSLEYEDSTKAWLSGLADREGQTPENWIRSGTSIFGDGSTEHDDRNELINGNNIFLDPQQDFENILGGTWAPYPLIASTNSLLPYAVVFGSDGTSANRSELADAPSVDIVFTNDKSKWSRSMVLEARDDIVLAQGGATHLELRGAPSVDKDGNPDNSETTGLGWFPGYAINLETGQRLNIAFAEDSWLAGNNGNDMKWNPTSTLNAGIDNRTIAGGHHYVYIFGGDYSDNLIGELPAYDESEALFDIFNSNNAFDKVLAFSSCVWAGIPVLTEGQELLSTEATVKLRVARAYDTYETSSLPNGGLPMYEFDMTGLEVQTNNREAADSVLSLLNVVPNPYYAFSDYETGPRDTEVKITNLPEQCVVSIYNLSGTLIRRFNKSDPTTSIDWDLTNSVSVPVAGGIYLIHINIPDVGERTLKWFGVIKPTDLNGI